jgi:hypothetical protein
MRLGGIAPLRSASWRLGTTRQRSLHKAADVAGGDDPHQPAAIDDQRASFAAALREAK